MGNKVAQSLLGTTWKYPLVALVSVVITPKTHTLGACLPLLY